MFTPKILKGPDMPKHLAIAATNVRAWASNKNVPLKDAAEKNIEKIKELIFLQLKKDIPILTIQLSTKTEEETNAIKKLLRELSRNETIHDRKLRIYAIGDWYNSEPEFVNAIMEAMNKTKDYDQYFLNLCIKYDGQQEILTAVKLLLKKAQAEKINAEDLKTEMLKENLPSSQFVPPEIIIENNNEYSGILLWDSPGTLIYYSDKSWMDFEETDFEAALEYFNKVSKSTLRD